MNASQQELFDRLAQFQFDGTGTELTFSRRLARENGWSAAYAEQVIEEYKKFLLLACSAGHVVTPSHQVDQAWHLHLTYTRSYWDDLCRNVLQQPLHHGPTKGGDSEQVKFVELYEQTLASYRQAFGKEPPRDIWSPAEQRFGDDLRHVSVNRARYWIIPKPRWPQTLSRPVPLFILGLFGIPMVLPSANPFDWKGPEFLAGYVVLTIIAALVALMARLMFAPQDNSEDGKSRNPLHPYEAACLAAGPARAVQAAFAALVQAGNLEFISAESKVLGIFTKKSDAIRQGKPLPHDAHPLERAVYQAAAVPAKDLRPLTAAGMPIAKEINDELARRGLVQTGAPAALNVVSALIMASPILLGLAKIAVGVARGRPVEFLIALCVLTFVAALAFLLARSRLSAAGKVTLESLQAKHSVTREFAASAANTLSPPDLAMTIGLFGAAMLATGPLANVHAMLPRASGGGDCSNYGGCGAGGCGGGGCGGGGCGGGGCGGCGGG